MISVLVIKETFSSSAGSYFEPKIFHSFLQVFIFFTKLYIGKGFGQK